MTNAADDGVRKTNGNGSHGAAPYIDKLSKRAHEAIDVATNKAGTASEWLGERQQSLKQSHEKLMDSCTSYICEKPMQSIGIAFAAGLVMSVLMGGSRRR
jgi:ElaB/YqjD/DUF883 family membrane-anchored ribosome-binding protein